MLDAQSDVVVAALTETVSRCYGVTDPSDVRFVLDRVAEVLRRMVDGSEPPGSAELAEVVAFCDELSKVTLAWSASPGCGARRLSL